MGIVAEWDGVAKCSATELEHAYIRWIFVDFASIFVSILFGNGARAKGSRRRAL
jgi:hypothetical protein